MDATHGRRDLVHTDPAPALLDFLHADRPGHRMRLHLHSDGRPAQMMTVPDLIARVADTGTPTDVLRAWQALWLRHRLNEDAPAHSAADADADDQARQRWGHAAADWYLTFRSPLGPDVIDTAVQQDNRQRAGQAVPALEGHRPARADELSASGPITGPVPDDVHELTQTWTARTRMALQSAATADTAETSDLADAYRLLNRLANSHPLDEARQACERLLDELTVRSRAATRLWALKAPPLADVVLGQAEAAANPYTAPLELDPAREQMTRAAEAEARDLTAASYASPPASGDPDAGTKLHDTMLRSPARLVASLDTGQTEPPDLSALRHDPYGEAWRAAHPRAARACTTSMIEAARPETNPARTEARALLEQLRTARLLALHAMLGRLHAHRPDAPTGPLSPHPAPNRAEELEQLLDRAAVLAAFPTTHDAHRSLHGMINSLNHQILATQDALRRHDDPNSTDAVLAAAGQRERATELRALIDAARRLEQIAPTQSPTTYSQIYANIAALMARPEAHAAPHAQQRQEQTPLPSSQVPRY